MIARGISTSSMKETMPEGFTIANFRSVAHGLQEGQFAVGERKKASGLRDLDPKYKRLLDEPVTMTLGLIGPDDRIGLTPICGSTMRATRSW